MPDFLISYTSADQAWAEWIGWILEEEGFSVSLQAWDFVPGSNFALEMQRAASTAQRTIAVLSPDYLKSRFAASEWAAAFTQDPDGLRRSLVPIRVRECSVDGLFRAVVYIDLVGLDPGTARQRLLDGLRSARAKPSGPPPFPGASTAAAASGAAERKLIGAENAGAETRTTKQSRYMPKVRRSISDLDRRRFVKSAFEIIRKHFEEALGDLSRNPGVDIDFTLVTSNKFTVEVFVRGSSRSRCKIWIGGLSGENGIAFSEGRLDAGDNSYNDVLSITEQEGDLVLEATMGSVFASGKVTAGLHLNRLTAEDAAEYLWRRFASPIEQVR